VFDNQISHVWKYNLAFEFYDWRQRSSYIPISMICIKISDYYCSKTWKQILKNAETCRPRSALGRHFFANLNFDGFWGLCHCNLLKKLPCVTWFSLRFIDTTIHHVLFSILLLYIYFLIALRSYFYNRFQLTSA
jgi:hypothetical protein